MNFAKHVKVRQEKFGTVVFDTLREKVFVTNETGSHILQLIEEGKSRSEISIILKERYRDRAEDIDKDINGFIEGLKACNILS